MKLCSYKAKATAYDQLMSGYMTVKEIEALLKSIVEGQEE